MNTFRQWLENLQQWWSQRQLRSAYARIDSSGLPRQRRRAMKRQLARQARNR